MKQVVLMVAQMGMSAKRMGRIAKGGRGGEDDAVAGGGVSAVLVVVAGLMTGKLDGLAMMGGVVCDKVYGV